MNKPGFRIIVAGVIFLGLAVITSLGSAATVEPVIVTATGVHHGGKVIYRYTVHNAGTHPIMKFNIGFQEFDQGGGKAELSAIPPHNGTSFWLPDSVSDSPPGWGVRLAFPEESENFSLEWVEAGHHKTVWPKDAAAGTPVPLHPPHLINPGKSESQFSVTLNKPDYGYTNGHALVEYNGDTLSLKMRKGDTVAPVLLVGIQKVSKIDEHFSLLNIVASAKDNLDPDPDIVFESITSNHPLKADDFQVSTEKDSGGKILQNIKLRHVKGREYHISYSATDATGNKTVKTVTEKF